MTYVRTENWVCWRKSRVDMGQVGSMLVQLILFEASRRLRVLFGSLLIQVRMLLFMLQKIYFKPLMTFPPSLLATSQPSAALWFNAKPGCCPCGFPVDIVLVCNFLSAPGCVRHSLLLIKVCFACSTISHLCGLSVSDQYGRVNLNTIQTSHSCPERGRAAHSSEWGALPLYENHGSRFAAGLLRCRRGSFACNLGHYKFAIKFAQI